MRKWAFLSLLVLVAGVSIPSAGAATIESKRSDVLAASPAADAKIKHKSFYEIDPVGATGASVSRSGGQM